MENNYYILGICLIVVFCLIYVVFKVKKQHDDESEYTHDIEIEVGYKVTIENLGYFHVTARTSRYAYLSRKSLFGCENRIIDLKKGLIYDILETSNDDSFNQNKDFDFLKMIHQRTVILDNAKELQSMVIEE